MSVTTRQLMRKEERVESLLAAAARAFARAGFAATSMEDIAAEAGITKLIVYRHFDGKKELYEAVLQRVSQRLVEVFREAAAEHLTGVGLRALITVAREDEDAFSLLFQHATREPQFAAYAEDFLTRITHAAETRLGDRLSDPVLRRWAARVVVRLNVESVIGWLEFGDAARDEEFVETADHAIQAFLNALGEKPRD